MKTDNEMQTTKLIEGKIPIGCVCPFKDKCVILGESQKCGSPFFTFKRKVQNDLCGDWCQLW